MKNIKNLLMIFFVVAIFAPQAVCTPNEDLREQAKILSLGKKDAQATETILKIPDAEKIASDYYILGISSHKKLESIKYLEKAIEMKKNYHQAHYNLGLIYLDDKNYEKAIYHFKQATKLNNKFAYGYYNLGCAYLQIGQYRKAKNSFEKASTINPEEPDYFYNLAYAYKKLNDTKHADKAIEVYNGLLQKRAEN